jgi:hypothetical protein
MFSGGRKVKVNPAIFIKKLKRKANFNKLRDVNVRGNSVNEFNVSNSKEGIKKRRDGGKFKFNIKWRSFISNRNIESMNVQE